MDDRQVSLDIGVVELFSFLYESRQGHGTGAGGLMAQLVPIL